MKREPDAILVLRAQVRSLREQLAVLREQIDRLLAENRALRAPTDG